MQMPDDLTIEQIDFLLWQHEQVAKEMTTPEQWYYLSFAEPGQWLGGCYVKAHGIITAVRASRKAECNPGGEVMCQPTDEEIPEEYANRLLTVNDLKAFKGDVVHVKKRGQCSFCEQNEEHEH